MKQKVSVVIEKDDSGYYAYCPELPGCQSQGATLDEMTRNIREAIALYLETLLPLNTSSVIVRKDREPSSATIVCAFTGNAAAVSGAVGFSRGAFSEN